MCVQPEPTISFYVDIRHAMFSYVINEGNSSRCLNEAMEKKKKKEIPSREVHLEVSLKDSFSLGARSWKKERTIHRKKEKEKKGERRLLDRA